MKIKISFLIGVWIVLAWTGYAMAQQKEAIDCSLEFNNTGICPESLCLMQCQGGITSEGCLLACEPAPCVVISFKECPLDRCELLEGCDKKKKVCYYKAPTPPNCGDLGYAGSEECCEGFGKRCGTAFFDGSCDMIGAQSIYSVPICVPCGNGVCNQFEDACNCKEDCEAEN